MAIKAALWTVRHVDNIINSFFNNDKGFSARKLAGFGAALVATIITIKHSDTSNVQMLSAIWLTFSLLCLGLVTFEQLIRAKNGEPAKPEESTQPQPPNS